VSEAIRALEENSPWARILAGGTDILPKIRPVRHAGSHPLVLIDIKRIGSLREIQEEKGWLVIGPTTTLNEVVASRLVRDLAAPLAAAAVQVGSPEVRNRGTVGGNVGSKNTGADLLVPLTGMKAHAEVCDEAGPRQMPLRELLATVWHRLGRRLVLTAIKVPSAPATAWGYSRFSCESMGRSYVSGLVGLDAQGSGEHRVITVLGGSGLWPRVREGMVTAKDLYRSGAAMSLAGRAAEEMLFAGRGQVDNYRLAVARAVLAEAFEAAVQVRQ
jgi:CO/xanthine dehydrogenase FAD-binding subunit